MDMSSEQAGVSGSGTGPSPAQGGEAALRISADECRVLGVLVEKAQTTPGQYPLTLNALVTGCNQLSNRDPVMTLDEERVLDALDALKRHGLVREVMLENSRVSKFRHVARDVLRVSTEELALLAELLLRGPQSAGSLRQNASRMAPIATLETCQSLLDGLSRPCDVNGAQRAALVRSLPPTPGTRAVLHAHLLSGEPRVPKSPSAEPATAASESGGGTFRSAGSPAGGADVSAQLADLAARVRALEEEVAGLRKMVGGKGG